MALNTVSSCGASEYGEVARKNFEEIEARLTAVEHVAYPVASFNNSNRPILPNALYPLGVMIFNTDDNAPNWSGRWWNGVNWVYGWADATGTLT